MQVEVKVFSAVVGLLALPCPSSGARQTAVAASGFRMKVEVEVLSAVVGLLTLPCPSSGTRQTAVAASGFRMKVEVEVFSAVVGLLAKILKTFRIFTILRFTILYWL
jgi:hypothetical protein